MKNWVKYIITSIFLLLLVGGKSYVFPKTSVSENFSSKKTIAKQSEENSTISISNKTLNLEDVLIELEEENSSFSGHITHFSFENTANQFLHFITPSVLIWKKIEFRNLELISLQSKIYLLIGNIRI